MTAIFLKAAAMMVALLFGQIAYAATFYGEAGTGRVVDAATGQPVDGAIIEASWEITNYRKPLGPSLAEIRHAITQTDASGEFSLPAWGPLGINLHSQVRSVVKVLDHSQPQLSLYKQGYRISVEEGPTRDPRSFWSQLRLTDEDVREAW